MGPFPLLVIFLCFTEVIKQLGMLEQLWGPDWLLLLHRLPWDLEVLHKPEQCFPRIIYGVLALSDVTRYWAGKGPVVRQVWFMLDFFISGLRNFNMCFNVGIMISKRESEYKVFPHLFGRRTFFCIEYLKYISGNIELPVIIFLMVWLPPFYFKPLEGK